MSIQYIPVYTVYTRNFRAASAELTEVDGKRPRGSTDDHIKDRHTEERKHRKKNEYTRKLRQRKDNL